MIKFSVVIPLYNKEQEIEDSIRSILSQSYSTNEIIVVDDGSTDHGPQVIVENFADTVKLVSQKNQGVSSARNRGIDEAKNEYIAFLDADDFWEKDFLLEIKKLIEQFPMASFYSTASKSIDEAGKVIKNQIEFAESFVGVIQDFPNTFTKNYGMINSSSFCVKKTINDRFPDEETKGEDLCYWLELSLHGKLAFSAKPLSIYRLDASNRSSTLHKKAIVPCPIKWFYKNKQQLKTHTQYRSLKKFIYSNILVTVYGGFGLSRDHASIDTIITLMKENHDPFYLLLYPAHWIPVWILKSIKKLRRKMR